MIEVIRQFDEIPGLRSGTAEPDSDKCVAISTQNAVQEMVLPGLYAVLSPLAVGFLVGPRCLTGMLGGAIASGMMLAITMANAGGAWDNSKKYVGKKSICNLVSTPCARTPLFRSTTDTRSQHVCAAHTQRSKEPMEASVHQFMSLV